VRGGRRLANAARFWNREAVPKQVSSRRPALLGVAAVGLAVLSSASAGCRRDPPRSGPAVTASVAPSEGSDAALPPQAEGEAPGVASAAPATLPPDLNVLLISVDSLRADMPWSGYPRAIAPRLTELEKRSVSYTRAYAVSSYTSMTLGGLLGGKIPSALKRSGYFFGKYASDNVMFPELLQKKGIKTLSAHAHGYFQNAGFEQGFDVWEIVPGLKWNPQTDENVTSEKHVAIAEKILSDPALDGARFFAWFHFLDPHDKYVPHDKDGIASYGKTARDRYDGEVEYTDRHIGRLLDFVAEKPWGKRTVIIVTSDHGEAFGEHGRTRHGFEIWEPLVRVPMFMVVPGVSPRRIDVPRSNLDLGPTIMEMLGAQPAEEAGFDGKSLVSEVLGGPAEARDVVIDLPMTSNNDRRRALVRGRWKIIAFGKEERLELYDVVDDPEESHPITKGEPFQEMAAAYRAHAKTVNEIAPFGCNVGCLNGEYAKKKKEE
jgi:choline-sulfatase